MHIHLKKHSHAQRGNESKTNYGQESSAIGAVAGGILANQ